MSLWVDKSDAIKTKSVIPNILRTQKFYAIADVNLFPAKWRTPGTKLT
ncbi:Uncharacterised protein [Burkholderia pseudomallei]|nr:Uncharacterised protein [Burkholderia pseudomallei]